MATISENLQQLHQRIASACQSAGRPVQSVTLLTVSKTFPGDAVRAAFAAGERCFGENYVQEGLDKIAELADLRADIEWHLIGPLQSNKTRPVAEAFDWLHSVDRLKIAERLSEQRPAHLPPLNVCLQVNISGEASKSGAAPADVMALAQAIVRLPRLRLRGLMAVPEPAADFEAQRLPHRALADLQRQLIGQGLTLDTLSMGMSADLEAAIAEGATLVRVGSAIFGGPAAGMRAPPRYQTLADELAALIASGALRPGDRLPSVRQTQQSRDCSASTVFQAYYLLESRGLVRAAPRSGYFVAPPATVPPARSRPREEAQPVEVSELVFQLLRHEGRTITAPFGSAFPSPALFPLERLRRALVAGSRKMSADQLTADLPGGHEDLRRQIALRYLRLGLSITPDEIVLTNGALEALNLSLQAVTQPGDAVLIESPGFYAALQALERLGLRAIELPTDASEGADLDSLAALLERHVPKACWLMSSFQNPLGSLMPPEKKRALVALLEQHGVPLIEDDVYADLYLGAKPPPPAKAFEQQGGVLHCGSFSKSLAPGFRVGWVAGGRFAPALQRLKLSSSLSGSWPAQAAVAEYLQAGGFDHHLRGLRLALARQQDALIASVARHFPAGTRMTRPQGGYFLWVELPIGCDSLALHAQALAEGISLAPGPMFSARREFVHCLRLNYGHPWTPALEQALARLGALARAQLSAV